MFCNKCGTQLPDDSRFCSRCGTQINTSASPRTLNFSGINFGNGKLEASATLTIVICAIMVLSMLVLPMYKLRDGDYTPSTYTISLLGDNYMPRTDIRDALVTASRVAFVFMLGSIIAVIFFKLTKKTSFCLIAAGVNSAILIIYNIYVYYTWISESSYYELYTANPGAGDVICIGSALALLFFSLRAFYVENRGAEGSSILSLKYWINR